MTVSQSNFSPYMEPEGSLHVDKNLQLVLIQSLMNPVDTTHPILLRYVLM